MKYAELKKHLDLDTNDLIGQKWKKYASLFVGQQGALENSEALKNAICNEDNPLLEKEGTPGRDLQIQAFNHFKEILTLVIGLLDAYNVAGDDIPYMTKEKANELNKHLNAAYAEVLFPDVNYNSVEAIAKVKAITEACMPKVEPLAVQPVPTIVEPVVAEEEIIAPQVTNVNTKRNRIISRDRNRSPGPREKHSDTTTTHTPSPVQTPTPAKASGVTKAGFCAQFALLSSDNISIFTKFDSVGFELDTKLGLSDSKVLAVNQILAPLKNYVSTWTSGTITADASQQIVDKVNSIITSIQVMADNINDDDLNEYIIEPAKELSEILNTYTPTNVEAIKKDVISTENSETRLNRMQKKMPVLNKAAQAQDNTLNSQAAAENNNSLIENEEIKTTPDSEAATTSSAEPIVSNEPVTAAIPDQTPATVDVIPPVDTVASSETTVSSAKETDDKPNISASQKTDIDFDDEDGEGYSHNPQNLPKGKEPMKQPTSVARDTSTQHDNSATTSSAVHKSNVAPSSSSSSSSTPSSSSSAPSSSSSSSSSAPSSSSSSSSSAPSSSSSSSSSAPSSSSPSSSSAASSSSSSNSGVAPSTNSPSQAVILQTPEVNMALEIFMLEYFIKAQNNAITKMNGTTSNSAQANEHLPKSINISNKMISEAEKRIAALKKDIINNTKKANPLSSEFHEYCNIPEKENTDSKTGPEIWTSRYFYEIEMVTFIQANVYVFNLSQNDFKLKSDHYTITERRQYARELHYKFKIPEFASELSKIQLNDKAIQDLEQKISAIKAEQPAQPAKPERSFNLSFPNFFKKKPKVNTVTQDLPAIEPAPSTAAGNTAAPSTAAVNTAAGNIAAPSTAPVNTPAVNTAAPSTAAVNTAAPSTAAANTAASSNSSTATSNSSSSTSATPSSSSSSNSSAQKSAFKLQCEAFESLLRRTYTNKKFESPEDNTVPGALGDIQFSKMISNMNENEHSQDALNLFSLVIELKTLIINETTNIKSDKDPRINDIQEILKEDTKITSLLLKQNQIDEEVIQRHILRISNSLRAYEALIQGYEEIKKELDENRIQDDPSPHNDQRSQAEADVNKLMGEKGKTAHADPAKASIIKEYKGKLIDFYAMERNVMQELGDAGKEKFLALEQSHVIPIINELNGNVDLKRINERYLSLSTIAANFIHQENEKLKKVGGGLDMVQKTTNTSKPLTKDEIERNEKNQAARQEQSRKTRLQANAKIAKPLEVDMLTRFIIAQEMAIESMHQAKSIEHPIRFALYLQAIGKSERLIASAKKRLDILNFDIANDATFSDNTENKPDLKLTEFIRCEFSDLKDKTHLCYYYYHHALVSILKNDNKIENEYNAFIPADVHETLIADPSVADVSDIIKANLSNKKVLPDYIMDINKNVDASNPDNSFKHLTPSYLSNLQERTNVQANKNDIRSLRSDAADMAKKLYQLVSQEYEHKTVVKKDLQNAMDYLRIMINSKNSLDLNPVYHVLHMIREKVKHDESDLTSNLHKNCMTINGKFLIGNSNSRDQNQSDVETMMAYAFYLLQRNMRELDSLPDDHLLKMEIKNLESKLLVFMNKNFGFTMLSTKDQKLFNSEVAYFIKELMPNIIAIIEPASTRLVSQADKIAAHEKKNAENNAKKQGKTINEINNEIKKLGLILKIFNEGINLKYAKLETNENKKHIENIIRSTQKRLNFLNSIIKMPAAQAAASYADQPMEPEIKPLLEIGIYATQLLDEGMDRIISSPTKHAEFISLALYCAAMYEANKKDVDFTKMNNNINVVIEMLNKKDSLTKEDLNRLWTIIPNLLSFFSAMKPDPATSQKARQVAALLYAQSLMNSVVDLEVANNEIEFILTSKPAADIKASLNDNGVDLSNLDEQLKVMAHQLVPTLQLEKVNGILKYAEENITKPRFIIQAALIAIERLQAYAMNGSDPGVSSDDLFRLRLFINTVISDYSNLLKAKAAIEAVQSTNSQLSDPTGYTHKLTQAMQQYNLLEAEFIKNTLQLNASLKRLATVIKPLLLNHDQAVAQVKEIERHQTMLSNALVGMQMVLENDPKNKTIMKLKAISDSYDALHNKANNELEDNHVTEFTDLRSEMVAIRASMSVKEQDIIACMVTGAARLKELSDEMGVQDESLRTVYQQNIDMLKSALLKMSIHYNAPAIEREELDKAYKSIALVEQYADEDYLQSLIKAPKVVAPVPPPPPAPAQVQAPAHRRGFKLPALPSISLPSINVSRPGWMRMPDWSDPKWNRLWGGQSAAAQNNFNLTFKPADDDEENFSVTHSDVSSDISEISDLDDEDDVVNTVVERSPYTDSHHPIQNNGDVIAEVNIARATIGKIVTFYAPPEDEMREQARAMVSAAINHGKEIPLYIGGPNKALCEAIIKVCIASDIQFSTEDDFGDNLVIGDFHAIGALDSDGYRVYTPIKPIARKNFVGTQGREYAVEKAPDDVIANNIKQTVENAKGTQQHVVVHRYTQ